MKTLLQSVDKTPAKQFTCFRSNNFDSKEATYLGRQIIKKVYEIVEKKLRKTGTKGLVIYSLIVNKYLITLNTPVIKTKYANNISSVPSSQQISSRNFESK